MIKEEDLLDQYMNYPREFGYTWEILNNNINTYSNTMYIVHMLHNLSKEIQIFSDKDAMCESRAHIDCIKSTLILLKRSLSCVPIDSMIDNVNRLIELQDVLTTSFVKEAE